MQNMRQKNQIKKMKLTEEHLNQLQKEIDHILDSGANSIRLMNMFESFMGKINVQEISEPKSKKTITDGDTTWINKCHDCGKASMQVVRPGQIQCKYCG